MQKKLYFFRRYCKSLSEHEIEELKNFASKRKKHVLGRGTVFVSDENRTCKEVRICICHCFFIVIRDSLFSRVMVNFTNILRASFCTKVSRETFLCLHFRFELFWRKNIGANALIKCW